MSFVTTPGRLWKRLPPEDRLAAATWFWRSPPEDHLGTAVGAIVKARRLRPQVARSLPEDARARILASIGDLDEPLASALLVALHLGERRPLLVTFLDAIGLPHEEGLLQEDDPGAPPPEDAARAGVRALRAAFPAGQVEVYLNTLWLQDPARWGVLARSEDWGA